MYRKYCCTAVRERSRQLGTFAFKSSEILPRTVSLQPVARSLETMRILSFLLATSVCFADIANHRYKQGEHVELWVNKVKHIDSIRRLVFQRDSRVLWW